MTANSFVRSRTLLLLTSLLSLVFFLIFGCGEPNDPETVNPDASGNGAYTVLSTIATWGYAKDVSFYGDTLFVAENTYGMGVYDISNLADPTSIKKLPDENLDLGFPVRLCKIIPDWNMIMISAGNEVPIITLDEFMPTRIYSVLGGKYEMLATFRKDSVLMNYDNTKHYIDIVQVLYADQTSDDALQKYVYYVDSLDIDDDGVLDPDTTYIHPFNGKRYNATKPLTIDYAGNYDTVVAALNDLGAGVVDVSGTDQPIDVTWLGLADTPGSVNSVRYQDGYIYAADGEYGLAIIDATGGFETMKTEVSWKVPGMNNAVDVAVQGNYLALADDYDGVFLFDITDPLNPVHKGVFPVRKTNEMEFLPNPDDKPVLFIASEEHGVSILELDY